MSAGATPGTGADASLESTRSTRGQRGRWLILSGIGTILILAIFGVGFAGYMVISDQQAEIATQKGQIATLTADRDRLEATVARQASELEVISDQKAEIATQKGEIATLAADRDRLEAIVARLESPSGPRPERQRLRETLPPERQPQL